MANLWISSRKKLLYRGPSADTQNVVTLLAQTVYDLGRTKECFLVMEFCEKDLVNVLESRGATYFEEKQILLMFRDALPIAPNCTQGSES